MASKRGVRRGARLVLILIAATALASAQQTRILKGKVVDEHGKPLKAAVVQLKNLATLKIRSFVTESDGSFLFTGLSTNIGYEVRARVGKKWSDSEILSRFDTSAVPEIVLEVDVSHD